MGHYAGGKKAKKRARRDYAKMIAARRLAERKATIAAAADFNARRRGRRMSSLLAQGGAGVEDETVLAGAAQALGV